MFRRAGAKKQALGFVFVGALLPHGVATAGDRVVDPAVEKLSECRRYRDERQYKNCADCLYQLYSQSVSDSQSVSNTTRIGILELAGEIYCIWREFDHAQTCYEGILDIDRNWNPKLIANLPPAFLEPILNAFRKKGFKPSPGLQTVALLDFSITDLRKKDYDLHELEVALPEIFHAHFEKNLRKCTPRGLGQKPLSLVPYARRWVFLNEIAFQNDLPRGTAVNNTILNDTVKVRMGRFLAVQGFVVGNITRDPRDNVVVSIELFSVETGQVLCSAASRLGHAKDVVSLLIDSISELAECACGDELREWNEELKRKIPEGTRVIYAFERYHKAQRLADSGDYDGAVAELEAALVLYPQFEEARVAIASFRNQQAVALFTPPFPLAEPPASILVAR